MPQESQVIVVQNQQVNLISSLTNTAMAYPMIATSAATASSVAAVSNLPVVYSTVTVPLVSAATRQIVFSLLVHPGQSYIQRLTMGYLAEAAAANLINSGMAPYLLGGLSGATVFAVLAFTGLAFSSAQGARRAYRAYNYWINEPEHALVPANPHINPFIELECHYITRVDLEAILNEYQTNSPQRRTLGLFFSSCKKSGEIVNLERYLATNPGLDFIRLQDLSASISNNGEHYKYRLHALTNHQVIDNGFSQLRATDRVINKIIDRSFLSSARRIHALKSLDLDPTKIPSQAQLNSKYKKQALAHHPDKRGCAERFRELGEAKVYLDKFLSSLVEPIPHEEINNQFAM